MTKNTFSYLPLAVSITQIVWDFLPRFGDICSHEGNGILFVMLTSLKNTDDMILIYSVFNFHWNYLPEK